MDQDDELDPFDGYEFIANYYHLAEHQRSALFLEYTNDGCLFWEGGIHRGRGAIRTFLIYDLPIADFHVHHNSVEIYPMFDGTVNGARLIRVTGCAKFTGSEEVRTFSRTMMVTEFNNEGWKIMLDHVRFHN